VVDGDAHRLKRWRGFHRQRCGADRAAPGSAGVEVKVEDVRTIGIYLMDLPLVHKEATRVEHHLDSDVDGVVATHGTTPLE